MKHSVIVVGAGVYGAAAALELANRGYTVTLLDPGPLPHPDAASTDISKVIRMDYGGDEFYMDMMEAALAGWRRWNTEWERPLFHEDGVLMLSRGSLAPGGYEYESMRLLEKRGHTFTRLTSDTLASRFPAWRAEHYPDGYFNPQGGWAESGEVIAYLLKLCQSAGVMLSDGTRVSELVTRGVRVVGVRTTAGDTLDAETTLVAAGTWTHTLVPDMVDKMWSAGQNVIHFGMDDVSTFQPPHFVTWTADVSRTGWYGFPSKGDGTLKIANHGVGLRLHPDEPRRITPDAEAQFRAFLQYTFPSIAHAPIVGTRLCLYCDTWDGDFYIDHHPRLSGLMVASGGSGHGFKFAPVLGSLAADVLAGVPNRYAARFAWRERGQARTEAARYMGN